MPGGERGQVSGEDQPPFTVRAFGMRMAKSSALTALPDGFVEPRKLCWRSAKSPNRTATVERCGIAAWTSETSFPHRVTFGDVWALLVDGRFGDGLAAEPFPADPHRRRPGGRTGRPGDVKADLGYRPLLDIDGERPALPGDGAVYVAQSARGIHQPRRPAARDRRMHHHHRTFR